MFRTFFAIAGVILSLLTITPHFVYAQTTGNCDALTNQFQTYAGNQANSVDVLPHYCSATETLQRILNIAFSFVAAITIIFIMVGGYRYITSAGNAEQAAAGKNTALYAVIGLVVVIMAAAIVNIIINLVVYNKVI